MRLVFLCSPGHGGQRGERAWPGGAGVEGPGRDLCLSGRGGHKCPLHLPHVIQTVFVMNRFMIKVTKGPTTVRQDVGLRCGLGSGGAPVRWGHSSPWPRFGGSGQSRGPPGPSRCMVIVGGDSHQETHPPLTPISFSYTCVQGSQSGRAGGVMV